VDLAQDVTELLVDRASLFVELMAGGRRRYTAARPLEEWRAELCLELLDRLADTRLGEAEPFGGAAEVQLLVEGEEDAELAKVGQLPHREEILIVAVRESPLFPRCAACTICRE
jgi:hypothetical protein